MRALHLKYVSRSRFGLHSLSSCCVHDAFLPSMGLLLLHYDCLSGTGQSSETNICTTQTQNANVSFKHYYCTILWIIYRVNVHRSASLLFSCYFFDEVIRTSTNMHTYI